MNPYVILVDSACDVTPDNLDKWGLKYTQLSYSFTDSERTYANYEMPYPEFYQKMRDGGVAKTAAVNVETFKDLFKAELELGQDVLYLAFSSGLSTTCNSGRIAAEELREAYPDRRIIVIDSLAASAGYGLLAYLAAVKRDEGASIDEVAALLTDSVPHLCHWFTVDDLVYLKRGGRVSPTVALVGGILGIKPVLHVDDEGHLINMSKVRGRKKAIEALADKYDELALTPDEGTVFISHGDCLDDATALADILRQRHGVEVKLITYVGPVIGAHSGPGTLALFFLGKHK
ncbi:MAG: DegV family protein [Acutalibacteraceae bacterium]|jgi:DegV family protein with EDD domain